MRNDIYLKDVVTLSLDQGLCKGCGMCAIVCPHGVFALHEKKSGIIERDACMECGACAQNCPFGAISIRSGVGCAYGIIRGIIQGTQPSCDCDSSPSECC